MTSNSNLQKVVFVCAHGAAKSILAGSYFNEVAERHGLTARAIARGTDADAEVSPRVRSDLDATGIPLCVDQPTRLTQADVSSADLVIAFDVTPTELVALRAPERWDALPALSEGFEQGKAAIVARVEALVRELQVRADRTAT